VADDRHFAQVEARVVEGREVVDRRAHVVERHRIPAALVPAEPAVLDVPGREAASHDIGGQRLHHDLAVFGAP
jgi:hypothetical protein